MILLPVVLLLQSAAIPAQSPVSRVADAGDPPARVARIGYIKGSVSLQVSGDTGWSEATLNYPVTTGDRLYTDQDSRAELEGGGFAVRLSDSTDLTLTNLTDHFMQLGVAQGTIRVSVSNLPSGDSIEVDTPTGVLSLLEVGEYRVAIGSDSATLVSVDRGNLEVSAGDVRETVRRGQTIRLSGANPVQVADVAPRAPDSFDAWSAERDSRLGSSASAQYVGRDIPGYTDLDDAGSWRVDVQYGPVWFPAGVPADWVPYRYGHWVWVEPWGWTWVEDESWGFAPFHYGRWMHVGSAWGWLPGPIVVPPCYAPALVVFVDGSPLAYGGGVELWYPLGPGEPYFPWYHHSHDYRLRVNEANLRNVPNLGELVRRRNVNGLRYVNRPIATTVVPRTTFRSGEPVAPRVLRVTPELARAPVTPHPGAVPTARAAAGGRPAARPPHVARPVITVPAPRRLTPPVGEHPPAGPPRGREVPSAPSRVSAPPSLPRNRPSAGGASGPAVRTPPPLVAKRPPPPVSPPFSVRQKAMQADPGRPLEPPQIENLRAGRPAGPMRDQEVPPHPAPAPRAAPAPRPSGKRP